MKITELIGLLAEMIAIFGDKEVTFINEETGEVRYIVAVSGIDGGSAIELEHVSYGEKQFIDLLNLAEEIG